VKKLFVISLLLVFATSLVAHAQEKVELIFGSWRTEDVDAWDKILTVFEQENPNIDVKFEPTLNTEYDAQMTNAVAAGTGPDVFACRPFDRALLLYQAGGLVNLKDTIPGLSHYSDVAKGAWSTDDKSATYCVPMASVLHGFIYNQDIFDQVGVTPPTTESEFFAVLDKIKAAGITPLDITTKDAWTTQTMGFENIWPNFAGGEPARLGLINGTAKYTDPGFVAALTSVGKWGAYLPEGHESIGYADAQQIFPLGQAAIYPSGSWEIPLFESQADFKMGAFMPYRPDDAKECWISDEVDIAVGMNAKGAHQAEAQTFLNWLTTAEFAQLYSDNQPGFFPLADYPIEVKDPLAAEFLSWRKDCGSTIRSSDQYLSRGEPAVQTTLADNVYLVVQGKETAEDALNKVQSGLEQWYKPMAAATAEASS
jgi:raffinose/stachyose/melibiose transport system substrate-binding protein